MRTSVVLLAATLLMPSAARAGTPYLSIAIIGEPPFERSEVPVDTIYFVNKPPRTNARIGVTHDPYGPPECGDHIMIPADWESRIEWSVRRVGSADHETCRTALPNSRGGDPQIEVRAGAPEVTSSWSCTLPSLDAGTYEIVGSLNVSDCRGNGVRLKSEARVIRVYIGNESAGAKLTLLRSQAEWARDYDELKSLLLAMVAVDPDDTGPLERLSFAAARVDRISDALEYHTLFVRNTETKLRKRYGEFDKWPARTRERWLLTAARQRSIEAIASRYGDEGSRARLTTLLNRTREVFALVRRSDGVVLLKSE